MSKLSEKECKVIGCERGGGRAKGMCNMHYQRQRRYGRTQNIRIKKGMGTFTDHGYVKVAGEYQHRLIAEKYLKNGIKKDIEIYHVDNVTINNQNGNLVVCPDRAYLLALHRRKRAYEACGHADWRKCGACARYSPTENMYEYKSNCKSGKRYRHRQSFFKCVDRPIQAA